MVEPLFFNRDLSWLKFNGRILMEAERERVPLLERIKFLAIFSSNLDEFYRVRMPILLALEKLSNQEDTDIVQENDLLNRANVIISDQQQRFGAIFKDEIVPALKDNGIYAVNNEACPPAIEADVKRYFLAQVMAFLQPVYLQEKSSFFPENNAIYFLINLKVAEASKYVLLNIPSNELPRFTVFNDDLTRYVVFLDDVIRFNLQLLFPKDEIIGCYSFKVTRDAELNLKDEYSGDVSAQIEQQLLKRDMGLATRFLYQPGIAPEVLEYIKKLFNLKKSNLVAGGNYHNLKDLMSFPIKKDNLSNINWPKIEQADLLKGTLAEAIEKRDIMVHTPFQSYDSVLRFFNEAALDVDVAEIYVTLYRVASDSKIVNALMSAAKNGKKVTVLVELKARFDEANNLRWTKKMITAGVNIVYSVTALKVHAKVALVKRNINGRMKYTGLFATGNFNESTAAFYTDHILMTADKDMLREVELLFIFLAKRIKPTSADLIKFEHLLVAQFNLQTEFLALIQREITHAKQGKLAKITIKLNNLEEQVLINKLYEASEAGVKIDLFVRSVCCLVPGVPGLSSNIHVTRIVDRYLEHGRIFVFHNLGEEAVYLGSADWMNRNVYRRIEVCFPIRNQKIKNEILQLLEIMKRDNVQAVFIDADMNNSWIKNEQPPCQSQYEIYQFLNKN
ncbi:polyphosphate kinase 1 [Pedobacter sp. MW01-1-1]|uniref:polyphosphate kinase 1 n=1 Tax=Pedobacter sp. MW01-1-1 TaxID=3383027 RepID=UPI003FEDF724